MSADTAPIELIGGPHGGRWIRVPYPYPPVLRLPREWADYTPEQAPPTAPPGVPIALYELGKARLAGTQLPPWPAYFFRMT